MHDHAKLIWFIWWEWDASEYYVALTMAAVLYHGRDIAILSDPVEW